VPYAEFDDIRLHIRQQGSGPVALFVHGFPMDSTMWMDQLAALSEQRRCIAVDLRGFGRSSPVTGGPLTMERHATDLAEILDLVSVEKADIVGMSMGGYVALAFVDMYPDRVRSLALVDTRAGADSVEGKRARNTMVEWALAEGRAALATRMQEALLGPTASIEAKARLKTMIEECRYETIAAALQGMRDRRDRADVLPRIKVPSTVLVGEHDTVTPPEAAQAMASAIDGSVLVTIPDAGHVSPIESPTAVNAALSTLFQRS
jgi:pimeloyl-ACP methyl ester carboxylesterase